MIYGTKEAYEKGFREGIIQGRASQFKESTAARKEAAADGIARGERNMLAKCIAAVESACHDKGHKPWGSLSTCINCHHGPLDALQALQEKS
jgi:hypothetical protein